MNMRTSDEGLHDLEFEEGKRNKAYQDTRGIWTIGVGHTGPDVRPGLVWTDKQVDAVFRVNFKEREDAINGGVKVPLKQHQFDALVSFTFNVGVNGFLGSTMLKKLNARDYDGATAEFDKWVIPSEITGRRMREKAKFAGKEAIQQKPGITTADVQRILGVEADGIFGPKTYEAVKKFQAEHGLVVDGIVGPKTLEAFSPKSTKHQSVWEKILALLGV